MQKQAEVNEEIFWEVSFRLSRSTETIEKEIIEYKRTDIWKLLGDEITSWLEDLDYKVHNLDVREAESLYDIFIGEDADGFEGGDCPKCSHLYNEYIDDDDYETDLIYESEDVSEGVLYCRTCGFTMGIGTDGWKVTGFDD